MTPFTHAFSRIPFHTKHMKIQDWEIKDSQTASAENAGLKNMIQEQIKLHDVIGQKSFTTCKVLHY